MPLSATNRFSNTQLIPLFPNIPAPQLPIKLLPSLTLAKGTLLGELAGGAAIPVGATVTIGTTNATTGAITASDTAQTVVCVADTGLLVGRAVVINAGAADEETVTILTKADTTHFTAVFRKNHAAASVVTAAAATGTGVFGPYVDAATDGTGVAKCILKNSVVTDASGNIFEATTATAPFGESSLSTPAYFGGSFATQDLLQSGNGAIDAAALTDLKAVLMYGTIASGAIKF